MKIKLEL